MKFQRALLASTYFVLLLVLVYVLHITFFKVDVVFYAAIGDGVLAACLAGIILFFRSTFRPLGAFEKGQLFVIWLLAGYAFAISVPTVIDRSLSFYILEKLQQRGGGIQLARMNEVFTNEYVREHRLIDVRLTEQQASGTVTIQNGCVRLTEKGRHIATLSRAFRQHLLPKQRLLVGQYSDDLTDPFRNSVASPDYTCH